MYLLTFRVHVTTPAVWMKWNGARSRTVNFIAGEGSLRRHAQCVRRAVCGGHGGLPLGSATHFHSVAIAMQPVHRLQILPIVHNQGASTTTPQVTSGSVQQCGHAAADRHTHTQTHRHASPQYISRALRLGVSYVRKVFTNSIITDYIITQYLLFSTSEFRTQVLLHYNTSLHHPSLTQSPYLITVRKNSNCKQTETTTALAIQNCMTTYNSVFTRPTHATHLFFTGINGSRLVETLT